MPPAVALAILCLPGTAFCLMISCRIRLSLCRHAGLKQALLGRAALMLQPGVLSNIRYAGPGKGVMLQQLHDERCTSWRCVCWQGLHVGADDVAC